MTTERLVRIFAGSFVLISLVLGVQGSPLYASGYWLWFTAFVGANLLQSGFTTFCPLEKILLKLGVRAAAVPPVAPEGPGKGAWKRAV